MSKDISMVNLNGLSRPLVKLIEAVQSGVGAWFEPHRIRRKAKAEKDAMVTIAKGEVQKQEVFARAARRIGFQEYRRQQNIESVLGKAQRSLPQEVSDQPVDPDWISRFFLECQDVSNEQLQDVWARLLANEVATPGAVSRRTLSILQQMDSKDASIFQRFSSFIWGLEECGTYVAIYQYYAEDAFEKYGYGFDEILHLDALGLIRYAPGIYQDISKHIGKVLSHCGRKFVIETQKSERKSRPVLPGVNVYPVTKPGAEIYNVVASSFCAQYFADLKDELLRHFDIGLRECE
jgi:uncharacterized repeat protein (TIGR03899 family)